MALATVKLEFAPATLATAAPAYTDVTADLIEAEWWSGKANDLDEPQAGGATFHLANPGRKYEPEYTASPFYPNIDTDRRFRLTLTDASGAVQQGIYYVEAWDVDYPAGTAYSEVVVTCVDGFGLLAAETLPFLDPPDATSYPEVVDFDQPGFYYREGEPSGSKLVSHVRKTKRKGKRKPRKVKWRTWETVAEVEGLSGPPGTYVNNPTLGEPGVVLGDPDTSVRFTRTRNTYARIPLDATGLETVTGNALSVEAWIKLVALTGSTFVIVTGPQKPDTSRIWTLYTVRPTATDFAAFQVADNAGGVITLVGTIPMTAGNWIHIVGTWGDGLQKIYVNGVLDVTASFGASSIATAAASTDMNIGIIPSSTNGMDGWIDEVAIYESVLSPARVLAHYNAGLARGYAQQLTGARIAAVASSPLWSTAGVDAGYFQVQPTMQFGQPKLDTILEAVAVERPRSLFFFDGSGNPIYKDFDALESAATAVTFGDLHGTEVNYSDVDLVYDNEIYNVVTGSYDGGELVTVTDAQSVTDRKTKTRDQETGMPLTSTKDVTTVVSTILSEWAKPTLRPDTVTVIGGDARRLTHVLRRGIGDTVRVKRRGEGGVPIDRQCVILGYRKSWSRDRVASATFQLSRGFNASVTRWRLGTTGFDELGTGTVLG